MPGREYTPEQFAAVLESAVARAPREAVGIARKGAGNVKRDARRNVQMTAPVHHAHAYTAIDFDVSVQGVRIVAEIGYDKTEKPGRLGNLLEFGGRGDLSPPHRDLGRALDAEEPRFVGAVADMGERLLGG